MHDYSDCPTYLKDYLLYMLTIKGRSPKTVDAYYIDLRGFLRYIKCYRILNNNFAGYDTLPINDITLYNLRSISLSDVYSYLNYTLKERSNNSATRARKVSSIRSFFKYLTTKTNLLQSNPVKDLDVPSIKKSLPKYLTLDEAKELIAHTGTIKNQCESHRDYCILVLFLNCGMRLSELVGINLNDIRDNTLKLLGKGNKERIIYLNQSCIDAIESYKTVRKVTDGTDKNALFLSQNGKRISARRVQQIVEEHLKGVNLDGKGYSPHKLRHTAATLMYQHGGVDVRILKEILGHSNLSTTEIYTHVSDTQMETAAQKSPLSEVTYQKKITPQEVPENDTADAETIEKAEETAVDSAVKASTLSCKN